MLLRRSDGYRQACPACQQYRGMPESPAPDSSNVASATLMCSRILPPSSAHLGHNLDAAGGPALHI